MPQNICSYKAWHQISGFINMEAMFWGQKEDRVSTSTDKQVVVAKRHLLAIDTEQNIGS